MKKSIPLVALLFLGAVVAAFAVSDTTLRFVAAGVALAGAVLLAFLVPKELQGRDAERRGVPHRSDASGETGDGSTDASAGIGENAPRHDGGTEPPRPSSGRGPRIQRAADIPLEYYRPAGDALPQEDPRAEFDFLTNRLLSALKENLLATTVGLFWINADRQQIVIGEIVSDSKHLTTARRVPLGSDLISLIGTSAKPQILPEFAAASEQDLLIYYDAREGVQSFVGVPVFFQDEPIAVVVADSKAPDAFGVETVASIGTFTSIISLLLSSYNQKYDLAADARLLDVVDRMRRIMQTSMDAYGIASASAKAISEILDWDYLAVILYNAEKRGWMVVKSHSKAANLPYVSEGVTLSIEGSIFQSVLDRQKGCILAAPAAPAFRFHEKEAISGAGQLCVVPVITTRLPAGLLVVEYRDVSQYGDRDIRVLTTLAEITGLFLDVVSYMELARKYLLIDEGTRTASRTLLLQRNTEEHQRITKFGGNAVFFLLAVDGPDELAAKYGQEGLETILFQVAQTVKAGLFAYDVLGRFDATRFGILLIQTTADEAYLRAEKIRKSVAGLVLSRGGSSFSVTVCLAGCAFAESGDIEHVLKVAQQAMNLAVGDGGNCVKVV
ncbi:MAG: diguanylate cyclase [Ignavibacteria bacterium]|nr:diguanylate cyclase [Ignavibacteria bacterium]